LLWRIWQEKGTPLDVLEKMTYEELLKANAILDMSADMNTAFDGLFEMEKKRGGGGT
jgi:hypothetical protein